MSAPPLVSIVVLNWNAAELLARALTAVQTTTWPAWECLVVDNGSTDESREVVRRDFPWARLVASPENVGISRGRNLGAEQARGAFLAFVDVDVVVTPEWLTALMWRITALPDVGVAFPTIVQREGDQDTAPQVEEVATMQGACLLVRREAFEALGGFDRTIFVSHEDTDFCWRAWLAGWRVVKVHEAVVHHAEMGHSGWGRRVPDHIRNGLAVHLRLMEWPLVARFAARLAGKTVLGGLRHREPAVLGAWVDTAVALPRLMEQRREARDVPPERREKLGRLATEHAAYQAQLRRQRFVRGVRRRASSLR